MRSRTVLGEGPDAEAFSPGLWTEAANRISRAAATSCSSPAPLAEQAGNLRTTPEKLRVGSARCASGCWRRATTGPRPLRDDKIITAWNGLMIAAYADGYRLLKNDDYRRAAEKCRRVSADKRCASPADACSERIAQGQAKLPAYLEDYAFLVHGLLRLHAATGEPRWLDQARGLTDRMIADFSDPQEGGFFFTARRP